MDRCPRCDGEAVFAGYEDARTFHQCKRCKRVWPSTVTAPVAGSPVQVRVLVVDDSDLLVGLVGAWLEDEGYAVMTATTGQQALDVAAVHHPAVVLLDLVMPPPDGFEVCGKLRRMPQPPEVILMTGVLDQSHMNRAVDLGALLLLRKPLEAEAVLEAVASAVRRHLDPRHSLTRSHPLHMTSAAEARQGQAQEQRGGEEDGAEDR